MTTRSGPAAAPPTVLVVGAGLLGSSVGLALRRRGTAVWVTDTDPRSQALACDLGAGEQGRPPRTPDVVVVAVPPALTGQVACDELRRYPDTTVTDIASIKTHVQAEVHSCHPDDRRFIGGHPLAGRERSGPEAARADLFEGQPWVLTPASGAAPDRLAAVVALVESTGATPVLMGPEAHDTAVALVSHVPQVMASLLAARLGQAPGEALRLAGSGLRDTTRIAGSDPELWTQILEANAPAVGAVLAAVADDLTAVREALALLATPSKDDKSAERPSDESVDRRASRDAVHALLAAGRTGRARIPGKHGGRAVVYAFVPVVVADEPGALARLLLAAGEAGVNVEDVSIEHSPGQPVGLVELAVAPERAEPLATALRAGGWLVH